jgi:hypothetical protein
MRHLLFLILICFQIISARPFSHESLIPPDLLTLSLISGLDVFGQNSVVIDSSIDGQIIYSGMPFGHGSAVADSGTVLITTDQMIFDQVEITIQGTAGNNILFFWGDGTSFVTTLTSGLNTITKNYLSHDIFLIRISGNIDAITEFRVIDAPLSMILSEFQKMENLVTLRLQDNDTLSGDLSDLSNSLNYFLAYGNNGLTGDLADLPASLTYFNVAGSNIIAGDAADIPAGMVTFRLEGFNTMTGDLADFPAGLNFLRVTGSNTISGNIADLPAGVSTFYFDGLNTVSGDIGDLTQNTKYFAIRGNCQLDTYTSPHNWNATMFRVYIEQADGYGLDQTEIDNLLIDLATANWSSVKSIDIAGPNATRSAASDAAVATLISKGCTLNLN